MKLGFVTAMLVCCLVFLALPCNGAEDGAFNRRVEKAIDRGAQFLLKAVTGKAKGPEGKPVQKWKAVDGYPMGAAAIQLYAIVKGDIPHTHPAVQDGLKTLKTMPLQKTYSVALYIMALDAVLKQMDIDAVLGARINRRDQVDILKKLESATNWMVRARIPGKGSWNYGASRDRNARYDHSNTQFAILGLAVAHKRGMKIPVAVWQEILDHFKETQDPKGPEVKPRWGLAKQEEEFKKKSRTKVINDPKKEWGKEEAKVFARGWSYITVTGKDKKPVTFNMTCAGASSVLIAYDALKHVRGFQGPKRLAYEKSIRDGIGKLITYVNGQKAWTHGGHGGAYYSLYSLEKVGDIGGIEKFGDFDWYRVGAEHLLKLQNKDLGCWGDQKKKGNVNYQTALAMLFLARATDLTFHNRPLVKQITGGTADRNESTSRDWVFLPKMQLEVPVRRIFRKLRYLPTAKLFRMVEGIVQHYDRENKPELIPIMLDAADETPFKAVKKLLMENIAGITGLEGSDKKTYLDFMKQWDITMKAGRKKDAAKLDTLTGYLKSAPSLLLKEKVIWAIMRINAKDKTGELIGYMNHPALTIRQAAYSAVKFLSMKNFPFDPKASESVRKRQVEAWQSWWSSR